MNIPRKADPTKAEPTFADAPIAEPSRAYYDADTVLDIRGIIGQFVKWSWIALICGAIGFYVGYKDTKAYQPKYVASMILEPNSDGGGVSLGPAQPVAGVSGVAATLSAAFGGGAGDANNVLFERLKLAMSSLELARRLDEKYGMLREVFARQWDSESGTWKQPEEHDKGLMERFYDAMHQNQSLQPGMEALSRYVNGKILFEEVELTSFWRVKVEDIDKEKAARLLDQIYWTADEMLRDQDRVKIKRKIAYLESRINETSTVDFRRALIAALVKEEHSKHLLEGGLPYAAEIVQDPYVSDLKTSPVLLQTLGIPTIAGIAVGILLTLLIAVFRAESKGRKRP